MRASRKCSILPLAAGLTLLSACATPQPRYYSQAELAKVARKCGVVESELGQLGEAQLLYQLTPYPTDEQLDCTTKWAKRHGLLLVYVETIEETPEQTEP